ncbi:outer membrane beta-barrel protein [Pedobacter gandavensis]|uniref:outer membrane beta-barrel protein n=1 Tax=Pedobacter gandavensis TaxID=2679963 RepID=UPI0029313D8A|nr:outer membrane beta-barrel protein [Pedobacter gandavensis]
MKKLALSILLFNSFSIANSYSQSGVPAIKHQLSGRVTDEKHSPLGLVMVSLKQGPKVIANAITSPEGNYQFKNIPEGNYQLLYRYVAYRDTTLQAGIHKNTSVNVQFLASQTLNEVAITAKKPIFQRQIDRLRFNVGETDLIFGSNLWEVIEKTPLVSVSSDGNIQISGTTGAVVYLNNKRKILSGNALKNYLSSIPSENLEAIEVMTSPSSKYDAEGGAGVLNIITKKNKEEGFIGNAGLSGRQTAVNSQAGSLYGNYREGKWNVFSNLYMSNRSRKPEFKKDIDYPLSADNNLLHRSIRSFNDYQILSPGGSLGIDHQLNNNHVFGLLIDYSGMNHQENRNAKSRDHYKTMDSLTATRNRDDLSSNTYALNLNYQGKLDGKGKTLSIDLDALEYNSKNKSISKTEAIDLNTQQALFVRDLFRSSAPQKINNQSLKADFEWPINKELSMDFGLKTAVSKINNHLLFENQLADGQWENDRNRSNTFQYNEHINSAYGILNARINPKWSYQLGLRIENTIANGWLEGIKVVDRNYTNLFPTAFLKYTSSKEKSYVMALSSRINRPGFWDVNPFRTYTTDQTYFEGNPFLMPSKYYREELSHTLLSKAGSFTFQLAASQSLDEIYALPSNPTANVIANKKVNYGNKYSFTNTITYFQQILPWWRLSGTTLTGYVLSKGSYANQILIDNKTFLLSLSTNQTFNISKKEGLSCTLIANNTFPVTIVNTEIGNRLETEFRLRKAIGAWNVTLSGQDFFKSNKDRYKIRVNDLRIVDENYYDTRSVALSLSFNFGKMTVKDKRDRATGSEEVKGRI